MKVTKRMFCSFLSVFLILAAFSGCGKSDVNETMDVTETIVTEATETTAVVETAMATEAITVPTTEETVEEYIITYEVNGGVLPEDAETIYTVETPVALPQPKKSGYKFVGWFETENFSGRSVTSTEGEIGNKIYYAKWEVVKTSSGNQDQQNNVHSHAYTCSVTKPSCTEQGYALYKCACGHAYKDNYTNALGHSYKSSIIAPTTEAQGYTQHTCVNCGHSYKDQYKDKLPAETKPEEKPTEHKHSYSSTVVNPTCTAEGHTVYKCACGHSYNDNYTKATGHNYKSSVVAPTTEAQGYTQHTCASCGHSYKDQYTDKLPAETKPEEKPSGHQHSHTSSVVSPTCNSKGYTVYTCSCGDTYKGDYVQATGHDYTTSVVPPTTSSEGYTLYTCTKCGASCMGDFVDKLPGGSGSEDSGNETVHTHIWFKLDDTCYFCEICGESKFV